MKPVPGIANLIWLEPSRADTLRLELQSLENKLRFPKSTGVMALDRADYSTLLRWVQLLLQKNAFLTVDKVPPVRPREAYRLWVAIDYLALHRQGGRGGRAELAVADLWGLSSADVLRALNANREKAQEIFDNAMKLALSRRSGDHSAAIADVVASLNFRREQFFFSPEGRSLRARLSATGQRATRRARRPSRRK